MKVGDIVRFLNATGGGKVTKIDGNIAYVEDADGFDIPVQLRECVVVDPDGGIVPKKKYGSNEPSKYEAPAVAKETKPQCSANDVEIVETEGGDVLNIVLGYEADEIKHLNTSTFSAYLVNDSNYFLYVVYSSRNDDGTWRCRFNGIIEPNIQVFLEELTHEDLPDLERISIQYVAFKENKDFKPKNPAATVTIINGKYKKLPNNVIKATKKQHQDISFKLLTFSLQKGLPFLILKSILIKEITATIPKNAQG